MSLTVVTAGAYTTPATSGVSGALTYTPQVGLPGGGLLLDFGANEVTFSLGVLYLTRAFNDGFNNMTSNIIQGSLLARKPLFNNLLMVGIGGYYGSGTSLSRGGSSVSYSSYGLNSSDAGLVASVATEFVMSSFITLFIEGRFDYGLTNVAVNSSQSLTYNDVIALIGLRFEPSK
jgi:hypothetical protein